MDEQQVRERAEAVCAALADGDIPRVIEDVSKELSSNLGEVLALLPLPVSEASVESLQHGPGAADVVVLKLVGENEEVRVQTRWKERGGRPTIVEVSHLSREETTESSEASPGEPHVAGEPPA